MILVTGSTGMIGQAVVRRLLDDGFAVRAHARSEEMFASVFACNSTGSLYPAENLQHSISDFSSISLDEARKLSSNCTAIVHCAGLVHQSKAADSLYESLNVRASKLLAEAAKENGVKQFIFLSSSSVYGNCATEMIAETAELKPDTAYASSKIAFEKHLRESPPAPSTVTLRPSLVFGEGDRGNMLSLIKQVLSGKYFIVGDGTASKSLIYAKDLAAAISLLLKNPVEGFAVFNLANPHPVTIKQLSEAILQADGKAKNLLSVPAWVIQTAAAAANCILGSRSPLSPDRLAKLTRHNSISVEAFCSRFKTTQTELSAAIRKEIDWARQENLLS